MCTKEPWYAVAWREDWGFGKANVYIRALLPNLTSRCIPPVMRPDRRGIPAAVARAMPTVQGINDFLARSGKRKPVQGAVSRITAGPLPWAKHRLRCLQWLPACVKMPLYVKVSGATDW